MTEISRTSKPNDYSKVIIPLNNIIYLMDYYYGETILKSEDFGVTWTDITNQVNRNNIPLSNFKTGYHITLDNILYSYSHGSKDIYSFNGSTIKKVLTLKEGEVKKILNRSDKDFNSYIERKIISKEILSNNKYSYRYYKVSNNKGNLEYNLLNKIENSDESINTSLYFVNDNPFFIRYLERAKNELRKFPVTAYVIEDREKG